jgi:cytochrome P450
MSEPGVIPRVGGPISNFRALGRDPEGLLLRPLLRAAPLVELPMMGARIFVLNERALVEEVLVRQHASLEKDRYSHRLREFLGEGLLTSEGALWRRQRRLIQPAFHRRRIAEYAAVMARLSAATFAGWGLAQGEQTRNIHGEMSALTLRIAGETLFGADMGGATEAVGEALELVMARYSGEHFSGLLPLWAPTRHNRRIVRAIRRVDAALGALIAARRGARGQGEDLLTMLLEAQDEDGSRMSDQQIRDECITLFLAGHETTALSTSYALYLLAQHPEAQARAQAAIDAALGGRPPTIEDLPRLSAVEEVLKEAMRLYPPAWSIGKQALAPVRAGAATLPRGGAARDLPVVDAPRPATLPRPGEVRAGALAGRGRAGAAEAGVHALWGRSEGVHRQRVRDGRGGGDLVLPAPALHRGAGRRGAAAAAIFDHAAAERGDPAAPAAASAARVSAELRRRRRGRGWRAGCFADTRRWRRLGGWGP